MPLIAAAESTPAAAPSPYTPAAKAGATPRLFTVGAKGVTLLKGAHALSNGEFLIVGAAEEFGWAGGAPRTALATPSGVSLPGGGGTTTPFILHVSADLETLKGLFTLPAGALSEVSRIRSTEVPGQPTGALVISGRFAGLVGPTDAYWIARLDGNGVDKPIRRIEWLHVVKAPGDGPTKNKPAQAGDYAERQPWDVRSDGQVVYAEGEPFATSWAALRVIAANGKTGVMPGWLDEGSGPLLSLKAGRAGSLRSATAEDFDFIMADENGAMGRKGKYPDDYYFTAHDSSRGPGYTGYRLGQNSTQRVSQLAIDRRDNSLYFGTSTQTKLPDGLPDFEPAFVALNPDGSLRWWARGYIEARGGPNSPPDQYVDTVAVDYAHDRLLVAGRCHGNNIINFWRGDAAARNRSRPGFKVGFTGGNSDIHISWLGRYDLKEGGLYNCTYVAELAEARPHGRLYTEGPLQGWPKPNENIDLNTTYIYEMAADGYGRAIVLGFGRRPYTTAGALIENVKPTEGVSHWTHFLRFYEPDLGDIGYSAILRGGWDKATGKSAGDRHTYGTPVALADGALLVGSQTRGEGGFSRMPLAAAPAWGKTEAPSAATSVGVVAVIPTAPPPPPPVPLNFAPEEAPKRRR